MEEKFKAIQLLTYPNTLKALKYYLDLTRYLQNYIHFYVQLAVPFQALTIVLLRHAPLKSQHHKACISKTRLGFPAPQEVAFFLSIQEALSQPSTLVYDNLKKVLWIDLDASKKLVLE